MTRIVLEADSSSTLNNLMHPVELCDASGRVLGRFVPLIDLSEWDPASPEISEEELGRRSKSDEKRYTTTEVIAHLEDL